MAEYRCADCRINVLALYAKIRYAKISPPHGYGASHWKHPLPPVSLMVHYRSKTRYSILQSRIHIRYCHGKQVVLCCPGDAVQNRPPYPLVFLSRLPPAAFWRSAGIIANDF
jgi:hypothetical protein